MKPKNTKERRNSFLKFLLLFVITVITIITAIFFTFKIPVKENTLLKEQANRIKTEKEFQDSFSIDMVKVKGMIDSLDVPGQNISYQNSLVSKKLVNMQEAIPTDDPAYKYDMYISVIGLYVEIQKMKGKLKELKGAEDTILEYKEALKESKERYQQIERELLIARQK